MTPVRLTGTRTPRCAPPLNPRLRMKITLDTATLTSELFKLQGIVSSKSTLPILHNALIEANSDGTLALHATDLEISVSTLVQCEVDKPGKIAVRARDLYDAVKNLRGEKVTL